MGDTAPEIVLILKNAWFNIVTVLTVLVALSNELGRWRLAFAWLEQRQTQLRQAWYVSLAVFVGLAALYAYLAHKPAALIIDLLTTAVMFGTVEYLKRRKGSALRRIDGTEPPLEPRRPPRAATREPVERPVRERPERVRRERRPRHDPPAPEDTDF